MSEQKLSGRELDAEVARVVFGWLPHRTPNRGELLFADGAGNGVFADMWKPSIDISAAWSVVAALVKKNWIPEIYLSLKHNRWVCELRHSQMPFDWNGHMLGGGESAPEAICRAALAALTHESSVAGSGLQVERREP